MLEVKKLKKGNYILHKGEPYVVKEVQSVVTGTHTHTKVKLALHGLFSGVNESITMPPHDYVDELAIIRKHGQVISKNEDKVQVMDMFSYETLDADYHPDLVGNLNEGDEITYVDFGGSAFIVERR